MSFLDRNAASKTRLRRNAQRTRKGDATLSIPVTAPIDNSSGTIAINLANAGGLGVASSKLTIKLPASSGLVLSVSGVAVNVDASTILINGSNQLVSGVTVVGPSVGDGSISVTQTGATFTVIAVTGASGGLTKSHGININVDQATTSIDSGNHLVVNIPPSSGLQIITGLPAVAGVAMLLADTSLKLAVGGVAANLATSSALTVSAGLKVVVDGSSITINGSNQLVATATGSGAGLTSLPLTAADTSIAVTGSGKVVAVGLATNSGLSISSGLLVTTAAANGTTASAGGVLVTGWQQLASDPGSPATGQGWFNTTLGIYKANGGLTGAFINGIWVGTGSSVITNSNTLTAFTPNVSIPANYFNHVGRTIRATAVLGGSAISGTFIFSLQFGGVTVWTSPTFSVSAYTNLWVDLLITVTSGGATGGMLVIGRVFNAATALTAANALTTVNYTTTNTLQWAGQFSIANASNSAQVSYWTFELIA